MHESSGRSKSYFLVKARFTSSAHSIFPFSKWQKIVTSLPSAASRGPVMAFKGTADQKAINSAWVGSRIVNLPSEASNSARASRKEATSFSDWSNARGATGDFPLLREFFGAVVAAGGLPK